MHASLHLSRSVSPPLSAERGFTLIELMITVVIATILMAAAAPSLIDAVLSSKLSAYANSLVASTNLARSEAIKRNSTVRLCASSNRTSCATTGGWEQGWIVMNGTQIIRTQSAASSGLRITEASNLLSMDFDPSGVSTSASARLTVCRATPSAGPQERMVSISATGRASVARTMTGSCS